MSKRRSKKENQAAQRSAASAPTKQGARPQVRSTVTGATRAKVPAGKPRPEPAKPARELTFDRQNYLYMGIGFALVLLGLLLMSGGRSPDYNEFNVDEIYSFRKITLAPIVMLSGLGVVIYGIFKR